MGAPGVEVYICFYSEKLFSWKLYSGNFTVENFTVETFQCEWGRKLLMFSAPLVCQRSSQGYFHHFRSVLLSWKYQENISKIIQTSSREALVRFPNPLASDIHGSWGTWLAVALLHILDFHPLSSLLRWKNISDIFFPDASICCRLAPASDLITICPRRSLDWRETWFYLATSCRHILAHSAEEIERLNFYDKWPISRNRV